MKISKQLIDAFAETTVQVMQGFMMESTAQPAFEPTEETAIRGDISSVIKLTDDAKNAVIVIVVYFPEEVARSVYGTLFGGDSGKITDICNLIAEIANVVAGNVKDKISHMDTDIMDLIHGADKSKYAGDAKFHFQIDIPTTIVGSGHTVFSIPPDAPKAAIPFKGGESTAFTLEIKFQKKKYN